MNLFVTKSLSFLWQKLLSLKALLVILLVTKPILSLNVRNSNEKKLSLKGKYECFVMLSATNLILSLQVANSDEIEVVTKSCVHISALCFFFFLFFFPFPWNPSLSLTLSLTQPTDLARETPSPNLPTSSLPTSARHRPSPLLHPSPFSSTTSLISSLYVRFVCVCVCVCVKFGLDLFKWYGFWVILRFVSVRINL